MNDQIRKAIRHRASKAKTKTQLVKAVFDSFRSSQIDPRKVSLEDIHAKQALNYANHNGKRFVVLTNGREWRLYDNSIQGVIGEKLLAEVLLDNTHGIEQFLTVRIEFAGRVRSFRRAGLVNIVRVI